MSNEIRMTLLHAGVRNLRDFGYKTVTVDNITTVDVYARFFKGMLQEAEGGSNPTTNAVINELLAECNKTLNPPAAPVAAQEDDNG